MASASYISAAANRFSHVADTSSENLVAFGASKFVAIWSVDVRFAFQPTLVTI